MGKYNVKLRGDKELRALLGKGALSADDHEDILRMSAEAIARVARERAPGSLGSAISVEVTRTGSGFLGLTAAPKVTAEVKVDTRQRAGFRYAWALDASKKVRYRNRATRKLTRSWFRGAKRGASAEVKELYNRAIRRHLGIG